MSNQKEKRNDNMKCLIAWMLVVFWMAVIFYFSSQPAVQSAKLSTHVTQLTISFFGFDMGMGIDALEHYIRKSAHFLIDSDDSWTKPSRRCGRNHTLLEESADIWG